jgi:hypothetical protein
MSRVLKVQATSRREHSTASMKVWLSRCEEILRDGVVIQPRGMKCQLCFRGFRRLVKRLEKEGIVVSHEVGVGYYIPSARLASALDGR